MFRGISKSLLAGLALLTIASVVVLLSSDSKACPFCSAVNMTFAEQMDANDIVVVAKLLDVPPPAVDPNADLPKAKFQISKVLKGDKFVKPEMEFRAILVGRHEVGTDFLIMGVDPPNVVWSTPMKASERVVKYISKLDELPKSGAERLTYFQEFFEDKESLLAYDAYDEFAKAPYKDLIALKPKMNREQLVEWIKSPETSINRRRLYFVMLGICGKAEDVKMLEGFITSGDRKKQAGLDSLIACYLNLKGGDGVELIEKTFLNDKSVEYVDTLAAVSALRFHGTEMDIVPKERIVAAVRLLLDRPRMADMVIPDLARWGDWSVVEKLVKLFKEANEDNNWIRVPVITYLRACPKPEAKKYLEELKKIDPKAFQRADYFLDFDSEEDDEDDDGDAEATEEESKGDGGDGGESTSTTNDDVDGPADKVVLGSSDLLDGELKSVSSETLVVLKTPMTETGPFPSEEGSEIGTSASTEPNSQPEPDVYEGTQSASSMADVEPPTEVAQISPIPTPVASTTPTGSVTLVLLVPFAASILIFLLLWSVISGWFERLIF